MTYDPEVDAAYIALVEVKPGEVARTLTLETLDPEVMMMADYDVNGFLLGIEIVNASRVIAAGALAKAPLP